MYICVSIGLSARSFLLLLYNIMSSHATIASCSLNQWALDWEGNLTRIKASILEAKARSASLRVGSELEVRRVNFTI